MSPEFMATVLSYTVLGAPLVGTTMGLVVMLIDGRRRGAERHWTQANWKALQPASKSIAGPVPLKRDFVHSEIGEQVAEARRVLRARQRTSVVRDVDAAVECLAD